MAYPLVLVMCYILVSAFDAAITIADGDDDGGAVDDRDGVQRLA